MGVTLDGPDRHGWSVLLLDGLPVADLDPRESAALAELLRLVTQDLSPELPLMQLDHAQTVPSSPDSGESRSRAADPESEHVDPRRAGAPPPEASSYACERATRVAPATSDKRWTVAGAVKETPLIVTLPSLAIGGQVWVRTEAGEPKADWRPHPHATWTPLGRDEDEGGIGGSVEVAP